MKPQTINLNRQYQHKRNNKSKLKSLFMMIFTLIIMLVAIGTGLSYRISITEEISINNRKAVKIDKKIKALKREIAFLEIQREELSSWANIKRKIVEFKLPLKPARYGQIVVIDSKPRTIESQPDKVASTTSGSLSSL